MNTLHRVVVFFCLCTSPGALAGFYVGPDVGRSEIDFNQSFSVSGEETKINGTTLGVTAGYRFDSNILMGTNLLVTYGDNFLSADDDYKIYEGKLYLGYSIPVHKHFRILPMLGLSRWELDTKEGRFLNSGPEASWEFEGTDSFTQVNFEFPVTELVVIFASYTRSNFQFGEAESMRGGVKFEF